MGNKGSVENIELKKMKIKCNRLLDVVENQKNEISRLKNEKTNKNTLSETEEKTMLSEFIREFSTLIKKADEMNAFIEYTYASKFAKDFMKIESKKMESLINTHTSFDVKMFLQLSLKMRLISENTVSCNRKKMYLISKSACELILPKTDEKSEEENEMGVRVG